MRIKTFVAGPVGTNCYIVSKEETGECFFVDMAMYTKEMSDYILNNDLHVKGVLLTHGHFDHIMGLDELLEEHPVPVYAFKDEQKLLEDGALNASSTMYGRTYVFHDAEWLHDGQKLELAGFQIIVIHTPGHTCGGCCYYLPEENCLFSGDTLFQASIGRTDLPTGSGSQLVRSVKERLFQLPDETIVYPGHMEESSIGYEKKYNPYV